MTAEEVLAVYHILYLNNNTNGGALLHFHDNNGYVNVPHCYVKCTLPILLILTAGVADKQDGKYIL
jgi:hypothetical protein